MSNVASKSRGFSWKTALIVCWHVLLAAWTIRRLYYVIPLVVEQFNGQFFSKYGGWDMSPTTFAGFAYIQSLVCMAISLSVLVNRKQERLGRFIWALGATSLMTSWLVYGLLRVYSPRLIGYDLPQFRHGVLYSMLGFDGLHFLLVALTFFACAAVFGQGPFSLLAALYTRLFRKQAIANDKSTPSE